MADIFLSYASADRASAEEIAKRLKAEGFSVWFDTTLAIGDSFAQVIDSELRQARVVVVLWSERSTKSSWVRREALIGGEQGKLVQFVLEKGVKLPLESELGPSTDQLPVLVELVRAKLGLSSSSSSRPRSEESRAARSRTFPLSLREAQLATFYWLGIGSAVLTLAGNLEAFVKLARWVRAVFANWAEIITLVWRALIPWRVPIRPEDAVVLTLIVVLFFNLLITSRHKDVAVPLRPLDFVLLASGALVIAYVGFVGFAAQYGENEPGIVALVVAPLIEWLHTFNALAWDDAVSFIGVLCFGVVAMLVAYLPFAAFWQMRPNINAFAIRLWRILFGLGIAVIVNQVSLFFENPAWQRIFGAG